MDGVGNVVATNDNSISITTQGSQHIYKIPKSNIEGYNGAEVFLDLSAVEMSNYDINSKSHARTEDTTTTSTTATKTAEALSLTTPTLPRTKVQTSTSITEKRTESQRADLASSRPPVIIDNKSSNPSNKALKTKREAEAIEHVTTIKESIEPQQQNQTIRQENLARSKENTNNYLRNDKDPLAANMTS